MIDIPIEAAGGTRVVQLHTAGLGDNTYVIRSGDEAAVVDAQRDLDRVETALRAVGGRLVAVLETHVHNDYVSGGYDLAQRHGADYSVPAEAGYAIGHRPLADGDTIRLGAAHLRALRTPGHTPHHTSYELSEGTAGPAAVFTGGCVMVGACGRTDLVSPELTEELTRLQYRSAQRIAKLGDATAVAPTHGAGSFCAASAAGTSTWTTVARERNANPAYVAADEDEFVRGQLAGLLAYPAYYSHMAELNRHGMPGWEPTPPPRLSPNEVERAMQSGVVLVDGRPRREFAAGHVPGSVNIELDPSFGTYVGWLLPFGTRIALVVGPGQDPLEPARQLARIGLETVEGVLDGGVEAWSATGRRLSRYPVSDIAGMHEAMTRGGVRVLDVRQPLEWADGHVPGATHIHIAELPTRLDELTGPAEPVYVYCRTGHRTAMAASLLDAAGVPAVLVDGGFPDWMAAGLPYEGGEPSQPPAHDPT